VEIHKNVRCPNCSKTYDADLMREMVICPNCDHRLSPVDQLAALLDEWYYPRRWRRDIEHPRARLLIETLWQQQFEPHHLYETLAPKKTNYEVFCYTVTNVVIRGLEGGWARLILPEDPMIDDPIYKLEIMDQNAFSGEMELLMPDVDWEENIEVTDTAAAAAPSPATAAKPKRKGSKRK
jgi:hypothetical protein